MIDFTSLELSLARFETQLDTTFVQMLASNTNFIAIGRVIGGLGALIYLSSRVWGHMARNEAIDFFPLLRPFVIAILLSIWPSFCTGLHGISRAVSQTTDEIRMEDTKEILALTQKRNDTQPPKATTVVDQVKEAALAIMDPGGALTKAGVSVADDLLREVLTDILSLASIVSRLALYLLSSLFLMMLCIAGPIAFGLAVFPGFEGGVVKWFGNFVSFSLWIPVANIFSVALDQIHKALLNSAISDINAGNSTGASDVGLMVFLALSVIAYTQVPKAAEALVAATGAGGSSQAASAAMAPVNTVAAAAGGGWGQVAQFLKK